MGQVENSQPYDEVIERAGKEAGIGAPKSARVAGYVRDHLERWRLYHFHDTSSTSPMKRTADVNDNRYLRPDASNLEAFPYFLRDRHEASHSLIRRTAQRMATFFDDFPLAPQELNPGKIRLEWRHQGSDAYFDASSLSDGTSASSPWRRSSCSRRVVDRRSFWSMNPSWDCLPTRSPCWPR